jgi:AcrR family transcriptional regulator
MQPATTRVRQRVLEAAQHHFARSGFKAARLEDIAADVGLTRSGLLRHFASKDELLLETHKAAALRLRSYLDAPDDVLREGFFETLRFWLASARSLADECDESYRVILIGKFATEFEVQERISQFWLSEDPEGTVDFVEFGQERGEISPRFDPLIVAAVIDWIAEGFCRSVAARELDRARLFHTARGGDCSERFDAAVDTILSMLRGALAASA